MWKLQPAEPAHFALIYSWCCEMNPVFWLEGCRVRLSTQERACFCSFTLRSSVESPQSPLEESSILCMLLFAKSPITCKSASPGMFLGSPSCLHCLSSTEPMQPRPSEDSFLCSLPPPNPQAHLLQLDLHSGLTLHSTTSLRKTAIFIDDDDGEEENDNSNCS